MSARRGGSSIVVPLLCAVQFVDVLGVTGATTAVPEMLRGVNAPASAAALIITPYAMFFGGLLVLGASLGDRFGHRRILLCGIGLFVAVSIVGGLASSLVQLIAARALLGAAAAISVPGALRLLLAAAPEGTRRTRALAGWSAAGAAAGAAGFIVGGVLTQLVGWPAVFWINVPVGILLGSGVLAAIRPLAPIGVGRRLDVLGAILLILAVMGVVLGATALALSATRALAVGALAIAVLFSVAFAIRMRRARDPLVPAAAFRSRALRAGTLVSFVNTATTSSAAVLATLELQNRLGLSPVAAGFCLVWLSLAVISGAAVARPISTRMRPALVCALGLGSIAIGNAVVQRYRRNGLGGYRRIRRGRRGPWSRVGRRHHDRNVGSGGPGRYCHRRPQHRGSIGNRSGRGRPDRDRGDDLTEYRMGSRRHSCRDNCNMVDPAPHARRPAGSG